MRNEGEEPVKEEEKDKGVACPVEELINQVIFENRRIFIYEAITDKLASHVNKKIITMDCLDNTKPIILEINSGGGSCTAGWSIVNTMKAVKSPIISIINGEACSMASIISVVAQKRFIYANSKWMAHDMSGGIDGDYSSKVEARAEMIKQSWVEIERHYKKYTKLNKEDILKARNKELWLGPEECYKKGIVDSYIDLNGKLKGKK